MLAGGTYYDSVVSRRSAPSVAFTMEPVAVLGAGALAGNDGEPWLAAEGLYFYAERGGGGIDLAFAPSDGAGGFLPYDYVAAPVNTGSHDLSPVVSGDGLTIWWTSNRSGGAGGTDVYAAHRSATTLDFAGAIRLTEVATAGDDYPSWISADGCRLYGFSTEGTDSDVWMAERTP